MEEAWERAVEAAMEGEAEPRALTLDGAVKCLQGRLPPPALLERFQKLERLSIANVGVSSLEKFPRLRNLRCLSLSDNRIASGLEFLVDAGLDALRDLDLSNNRIGSLEDLAPLAQLRLVSLDLYECPVTRIKDYRSKVFAMIRSLKYLDKMDAEENERPESDDDEDDDEDEDEDDDLGNGEVNGEENGARRAAGNGTESIIDVDDEEESEADEDMEYGGILEANESNRSRAFQVTPPGGNRGEEEDDPEEEDVDGEEDDDDFGEEIDEEDDEDDEDDVVEVHEIEDSDEDDDGDDDDDDDEDDEEEEEDDYGEEEPGSNGRVAGAEGMINGHDHRKEDEQVVEDAQESEEDDMDDGEDEEEDLGAENYLLQPIAKPYKEACNKEECNEEDEGGEDRVDAGEDDSSKGATTSSPSSFLQPSKRKRDSGGGVDDNDAEDSRSSKHR